MLELASPTLTRGSALMRYNTAPVLLAIAGFAFLLTPVVWLFRVGKTYPPDTIPAPATQGGFHSATNYVSHGIYFALILLFAWAILRSSNVRVRFYKGRWKGARIAAAGIVLCLTISVPFACEYPTYATLLAPMTDLWHEGEILGVIPSLVRAGPYVPKPVVIHGPGETFLPGIIASATAPPGQRIVAVRLVFRIFGSLAFLALIFVIVHVILQQIRPRVQSGDLRTLLFVAALCVGLSFTLSFGQVSPRRLFFWLQLGMLFYLESMFRTRSVSRTPRFVALALGFSIPFGIVYNYSFGISGALIVVLGSGLLMWRYRAAWLPYLLLVCTSALTGTVVLGLGLGVEWIYSMARDIQLWSATGRLFSVQLPLRGVTYSMSFVLATVSILAMFFLLLSRLRAGNIAAHFATFYATVLLSAMGALEFRSYLDRPDLPHLALIMPSIAIIAAYILVATIEAPSAFVISRLPVRSRYILPCAIAGFFTLADMKLIDPFGSVRTVLQATQAGRYRDQYVVPPAMWRVASAMGPELANQRCMYSLTTSPVWYYLFDVPSCSSFYFAPFARTRATQEEIIADLKRAQPRIIIAGDETDGPIDNIPVPVSCPGVWRFVSQTYEPYRTIEGVAFYRLRSSILSDR